ncbi:DegT/DnrJ/EryC1/StrS family aminotransferase [Micromonospora craniellae]|uniref:DegT/DnrJ/EryC1/StrS family aminotransferase n=1 Tax=Micromonospora craniellae TaxID=2294034 RepID=A0A372FSS1_9ACTN|nr:DegT/DnrJ/EryC1/StrS family aminotransferase [Micromonospora craniellae]QOC91738.1 DegT/DnrJ/EryC1/StrS family aminotransferase [Micromonospora craniellae]RFS43758.1 DegT/DnrJ/EryC1/StrS family aminotransferase [Micromonospora craniellae]
MSINVWSYLTEYEAEREDLLEAVDKVFGSGQLMLGASVRSFETAFAAMHHRSHCVGVDNGTNALVLALRSLGVGQGDEVITVSNTAAPTVVAIDAVGATPTFVDVRPETQLMDVAQLADAVTERTRCILPVHLYGQAVDMMTVRQVAHDSGLAVLEDCAQAHGARQEGRIVGSFGDAAAFSFYPTKVLGAYGDGGAVIADDEQVAATLRRLRYYGMEDRYYVVETPGFNSRLDEVQAEILFRKLSRLEQYISARRAIAATYDAAFAGTDLGLPTVVPGNEHVYYLYVVRHPARDEIIRQMKAVGIGLNISYPWPVHTMSGFAHLGQDIGSLPVTERLANEVFSLPMYPTLSASDQARVIDELLAVLTRL